MRVGFFSAVSNLVGDFEFAPGVLFVVATPIGNLGDISPRALACLSAADVIACEDTRHTARLVQRYDISTARVSLHAHNEAGRLQELLNRLEKGDRVALVSDAGMPTVSDPGQRLIHHCHRKNIPCDVIPGPSAVPTALAACGFPADRFYFGGFLPNKSGRRVGVLTEALTRDHTTVFFESPHRIARTLAVLADIEPERLVCVARELTKKHQEFLRGPVAGISKHKESWKGEITLVIAPAKLPKWMLASEEENG